MPPRDPALPEGTDHIIQGAAQLDGGTGSGGGSASTGGGSSSGFVASSGGGDDTGGTAASGGGVQRIREQVLDQIHSLKGQATDKARGFADDGKDRATTMLDDFGSVIKDAARAIEERFGPEYSGYADRAAGAVSNLAGTLRDRDIEDLLDDTRNAIRRSPGIAIGIAAVAGFALVRILKTGFEESGVGSGGSGGKGSGGSSRGSRGGGGDGGAPAGGRTGTTTGA